MILLKLFLIFLKIGLFAFGGGYGMISFMVDECITNDWLIMEELLNFIAVAESMPGPIAVDMSTFIGASQAGFLGALLCAIAVVTASFVLMLLIAKYFKKALQYTFVRKTLNYIQPVVTGILLATATTFLLSKIFNITTINSTFLFNWKGLIIFGVLIVISLLTKIFKKRISPIILIILSGILGVLIF